MTIVWSDIAIDDVSDNIYYLEKEWSEKEINNFNQKIEEVLNNLSEGIVQFKPTKYNNIFQVVITKQITLYYEVKGNDIILLRFWNNYRNPDKFIM